MGRLSVIVQCYNISSLTDSSHLPEVGGPSGTCWAGIFYLGGVQGA